MSVSLFEMRNQYRELLNFELRDPAEMREGLKRFGHTDTEIEAMVKAAMLDDVDAYNLLMEENFDDIDTKLSNYGHVVLQLNADEKALTDEIKRLTKTRDSVRRKRELLKEHMKEAMIETGHERVKDVTITVSLAKNPPKLEIDEGAMIPVKFLIQPPPEPDKSLLKKALKDGEVIDGCRLTTGMSVRIK